MINLIKFFSARLFSIFSQSICIYRCIIADAINPHNIKINEIAILHTRINELEYELSCKKIELQQIERELKILWRELNEQH